jgi:tetratricopeptide (TPR) repeat protein
MTNNSESSLLSSNSNEKQTDSIVILTLSAEEWKVKGNEYFKKNDLKNAIDSYDNALKISPTAVLYTNRATCEFKLENYGNALANLESAIALDPKYAKIYYRRGCCYISLGKLKDAVNDFTKLCQLNPQSAECRDKLKDAKVKYRGLYMFINVCFMCVLFRTTVYGSNRS